MMALGGMGMVLMMMLFWVAVVVLALWVLSRLFPVAGKRIDSRPSIPEGTMGSRSQRARDVLDERYARGELSREQFDQMRRDLGV